MEIILIINWFINISTFLSGYALGYYVSQPEKAKQAIKAIKRKIRGKTELGGISKLTAQELRKRGTREEETEKAMEETIEKIIR